MLPNITRSQGLFDFPKLLAMKAMKCSHLVELYAKYLSDSSADFGMTSAILTRHQPPTGSRKKLFDKEVID